MNIQLLIDILIVLLLIPTIIYAFLLNKKMSFLQKNKEDMMKMVVALDDATSKAEMGMPKLKAIADKAITTLQDGLNKADGVKDDLSFLIEKADSMADRLEGKIRVNKTAKVSNLDASKSYASNNIDNDFVLKEKEVVEVKSVEEIEENMNEKFFENEAVQFGEDRSEAELELLKALRSMK